MFWDIEPRPCVWAVPFTDETIFRTTNVVTEYLCVTACSESPRGLIRKYRNTCFRDVLTLRRTRTEFCVISV